MVTITAVMLRVDDWMSSNLYKELFTLCREIGSDDMVDCNYSGKRESSEAGYIISSSEGEVEIDD